MEPYSIFMQSLLMVLQSFLKFVHNSLSTNVQITAAGGLCCSCNSKRAQNGTCSPSNFTRAKLENCQIPAEVSLLTAFLHSKGRDRVLVISS